MRSFEAFTTKTGPGCLLDPSSERLLYATRSIAIDYELYEGSVRVVNRPNSVSRSNEVDESMVCIEKTGPRNELIMA